MWPFDHNKQQVYQQYAQAYDTGNFGGFDPGAVIGHIQQFMQGAPADQQQQIYQQHFEQMPYEHRVALAQQLPPQYAADPNDSRGLSQSFMRMGQEQPHLLQSIFSHPLLLGAGVGLAGLIAKHMLKHHQGGGQQSGGNQGYNQGYNQGFQNQSSGYGYQDPNLQQELTYERQQEQELRRELQNAESRLERLEEEEQLRHHHHHRDNY